MLETLADSSTSSAGPWWILFISIAWVVFSIAKFKMHPFLAMMIGAVLVGLLSGPLPEPTIENKGLFHSRVDLEVYTGLVILQVESPSLSLLPRLWEHA